MAKPKPIKAPASRGSRRDRLASLEATRKADQRRRTVGLLVICLVLAAGLLAYPVYLFAQDYRARTSTLADLGVSLESAGCDPAASAPATGNQDHVGDGEKVPYARFPPDSGPHYASPAPFTKRFYSTSDRPPVETLVHNLEHGYTVAWYRDTMPERQREQLEDISKTFSGDEDYNPQNKFIAAPWAEADGAGFPEGKDVVLTHWTADPNNPTAAAAQLGVRQACTTVSGAAVGDFMAKYPAVNSPEPNGA